VVRRQRATHCRWETVQGEWWAALLLQESGAKERAEEEGGAWAYV
jgi:hypothetical protein